MCFHALNTFTVRLKPRSVKRIILGKESEKRQSVSSKIRDKGIQYLQQIDRYPCCDAYERLSWKLFEASSMASDDEPFLLLELWGDIWSARVIRAG